MKKFKRLIAIVTVLLFALSIIAPAFAQDEATTEETGSVYDQAAKILQDKGILKGNEQGDLMLDKELTRAEILAMIIRATGQEDVVKDYVYAEQSFSDVPNTHWAFAYVEAGKDLGIVNGYPDGTFKPDKSVKFEELCKMLVAAKGENPASGKWPLNYVRKALELGFFNGIEDDVGIGDVVKRGQAAVAFANAFFPPEKTIAVKDVKVVANDTIEVYVDVYLNNEPATLEDGDVIPLDFEIKDAKDDTKTVAVTQIDTDKSDFANGKIVLKTAAQTANATYKLYFKGKDTGKTFVAVPVPLTVTKVEALNYKEIKVTFNKPVDDASAATNKDNYTVYLGNAKATISSVILSSDKTNVRLFLSNTMSSDLTTKVTVAKAVGLAEDYTSTIQPFVDSTAPTVENVVPIGLMKLKVIFSEPVLNSGNTANYIVDNSYYPVKADPDTSDYRSVVLTFGFALSAGNHVIEFNKYSTNTDYMIKDYAQYLLINTPKTFTMSSDTTALTTPTVISATQTSVQLKFNKGIADITSVSASPSGTWDGVESIDVNDPSIVTLNFYSGSPLPAYGVTLTITAVDISGTSATLSVSIPTVTVDVTPPTITSYSIDSPTQISLIFSENVIAPSGDWSNYVTITDSNNALHPVIDIKRDDANNNKNKLIVTIDPNYPLPTSGTISVSVKNVVDDTPRYNPMVATTLTINAVDKTAPTVSSVVYDATSKKVYVIFSEAVNATTALNPYNYVLNSAGSLLIPTSANFKLLADGKTVVMDFAIAGTDLSKLTQVQIVNVQDLAGNTMAGQLVAATPVDTSTAPTVETAAQIATNQIKLDITSGSVFSPTLSAGDFIVKDGQTQITITGIKLDDNGDIIITLATSLGTDAGGGDVTVTLNPAGLSTRDIYDRKIRFVDNSGQAITTLTVGDGCAPTITTVEATYQTVVGQTYVTINFSENVNVASFTYLDDYTQQFRVYIDGSLTAIDGFDNSVPNKLIFKFNGDKRYKSIRVDYVPPYDVTKRIKDLSVNNNELAATSVNATWK
ncbi:S-layer domain protein [Caldicellulosiruptor hydrothermalis 108]|uniref:S-layer domain protein n=1 Tax=Caldicellulosiruptor hydrothermalis (strain DSM 18901 / VKM B-2411 / 108) TaxID=632292 RepID=E4QC28_CALH1|nr:S-layer homology domain-containing protein [Caldicellulosiruptor hydrothermalis]ADQ06202.1 S-layer domain protein [Caldicellulosiruptor hydrothermalis 108]